MYTAEAVSKFSNLIIHYQRMKINKETWKFSMSTARVICENWKKHGYRGFSHVPSW